MRYLKDLLTLGPSLLIWTLTVASAESIAFIDNLQQPLSPPFHYARTEKTRNDRYSLSRVRDSIIQSIWRIPTNERLKSANAKPSASRSSPPSQLLARYGGDLVLRFEIRSAEEAEALADAINVLFLDLWEFTAEWVDIRLSKDVVSFLTITRCCNSTNWPFPGSFVARSTSALTTTCAYSIDARSRSSHLRIIPISHHRGSFHFAA